MTDVAPVGAAYWDAWRARYDEMSFADQCAFYDEVWQHWPYQAYYNPEPAKRALAGVVSVVEIGGWQGHLAADVLGSRPDFERWTNYDICLGALDNPATDDPRYEAELLTDHPWEVGLDPADALVATHFIEHIKARELELLVERVFVDYRLIYLEAPIAEDAVNYSWGGQDCSHILEWGWVQVGELLGRYGFEQVQDDGWCRAFRKTTR